MLGFCASDIARADELSAQDVSAITSQMESAETAGTVKINCDPSGVSTKPSCSAVSDAFCSKLYDKSHAGNIKVHDGQFNFGKSKNGACSMVERMNLEALVVSEKKLPADLRAKVSPILANLKTLLAKEKNTDVWKSQLSTVTKRFAEALQQVAEARVRQRHPELASVKPDDRTIDQKNLYSMAVTDLNNEVLKAKYGDSPNWERVKRVFKEAQDDIYDQIESLNFPPELKDKMRTKLKSVVLALPYDDARISAASADCSTTEQNAFYAQSYNNFSVCAGLFNSIQSDSGLYLVIAHELSHALDPPTIADDDYKKTDAAKTVSRLVTATGPAFSCQEWEKLTKSTLDPMPPIREPKSYPYSRLTDCLAGGRKLDEFSDSSVRTIAKLRSAQKMKVMAEVDAFAKLSEAEKPVGGKKVANPFYMRPDRVYADINDNFFPTQHGSSIEYSAFVQSLSCQRVHRENADIGYEQASAQEKAKMMDQAVQQTKDVYQAVLQNEFSVCGRECDDKDLRALGVSRNLGEHFADWLAVRAFPRFLSRQGDLRNKQQAAEIGMAFYCEDSSPKEHSDWVEKVQKKYSLEPHPMRDDRRMSLFTNHVAEAIGCTRDEKVTEGDAKCEP